MPVKFTYKLEPRFPKKCKNCEKEYLAVRPNQKYCSKNCSTSVVYEKKKKEIQKSGMIKKRKEQKKESIQTQIKELRKNPDTILGREELAEYLNIGYSELQDNIKTIWADIPQKKIHKNSASGLATPIFSKKDIDQFFINKELANPKELTLTLKGYKEPLRPVDNGFGYKGVLLQTDNGEYVQCHICGKLFKHMSGHIWKAHKIKSKEYKKLFDLSLTTALTSESQRWEMKKRQLEYLRSLSQEELEAYKRKISEASRQGRFKRSKNQPKKSLEAYNKEGTCPDQLIQKIRDAAERLGKTPSLKEFVGFCGTQQHKHLIFKVYGSWKKAVELSGLNPLVPRPSFAGPGTKPNYTRDELLEYLKIFAEENDEIPTHTDFKTGLLPNESTYTNRFGSVHVARELAGVYEIVSKEKVDLFFRRNGNHPRKTGFKLPQIALFK